MRWRHGSHLRLCHAWLSSSSWRGLYHRTCPSTVRTKIGHRVHGLSAVFTVLFWRINGHALLPPTYASTQPGHSMQMMRRHVNTLTRASRCVPVCLCSPSFLDAGFSETGLPAINCFYVVVSWVTRDRIRWGFCFIEEEKR